MALNLPVGEFLRLCESALDYERKNGIREEWLALFPWMMMKHIKYMSFREYFDQRTGANIDMRPAAEILADVEKIRRQFDEHI